MTIRILVLAGVLASAGPLGAQQLLDLPPPPDDGEYIREYLVPGNGQGFAGLAFLDAQGPAIAYDSVWVRRMGGMGSAAFEFLRAHEYAHHRLGHPIRQYQTPPSMLSYLGFSTELEADCEAVQVLADNDDWDAVEAGEDVYRTVLPPTDTPDGRPGARRRIENMRECLGEDPEPEPGPGPGRALGRSCGTPVGTCGPFYNQPALPLGASCYCATPNGPISGAVVQP